jgi:hypothetical protein
MYTHILVYASIHCGSAYYRTGRLCQHTGELSYYQRIPEIATTAILVGNEISPVSNLLYTS